MDAYQEQTAAYLERADMSLRAARDLLASGYPDFAASRAYYAAFYAAKAALLCYGFETSKHSGVMSLVHQHFIKTGKMGADDGDKLDWLFQLRTVADYGSTVHVTPPESLAAIEAAEQIVKVLMSLMPGRPTSS